MTALPSVEPRSENDPPVSGACGRFRTVTRLCASALGLAVGLIGLCGTSGCARQPPRTEVSEAGQPRGKPWETAARRLRKDTDPAACKAALNGLNNDLAADPFAPHPTALSKDAQDALTALVPLNPDDLAEVRPAAFTAHDAAYLAECFYLRDCANSLNIPGLSAEKLGDLAFRWVCRQVYLHPWLVETPVGLQATALPPTYVLRRGYGSGLERAYVFLALLQQLQLDGCLIGPPNAGNTPAGYVALGPDNKTVLTGTPRGPFWAVGVRVGHDVRLYDPWRGEPFPASLNELRAHPEAHKAWFADPANGSGVSPEDLKAATLYLAVPVNSLAPRMVALQKQLGDLGPSLSISVTLSIDPAALQARFPDPKPAFWNPPSDPFAYGRTARTFLPQDEGGTDRSERGARLYDRYLSAQLPAEMIVPPPELRDIPEAIARLRAAVAGVYAAAFIEPPNPRERIHRGEFQNAARELVVRQDRYWQGLERLRNNPNAEVQIRDWARKAVGLYEDYRRARFLDKNKEAEEAALRQIDRHWQSNLQTLQLVLDRASADIGHAEATFLMALCKHEQAEQIQARLENASGDTSALRQEAQNAWAAAAAEWRTYATRAAAHARVPGRAEYVKWLSARANQLAEPG